MIKSIFFKEWIKVKKYFFACLLLNIFFLIYYFLFIRHLFNVEHSEFIWYRTFEIGTIYYDMLKWPLLISGIILGTAQFAFEMISHRFRLSLHLPCSTEKIVFGHLSTGLFLIFILLLMVITLFSFINSIYFPVRACISFLLTALPWFISSLAVYLGTALVFLEPSFYKKIVYFIVTSLFIVLFFMGQDYEAYNKSFLNLLIVLVLLFFSVFISGIRYRMNRG